MCYSMFYCLLYPKAMGDDTVHADRGGGGREKSAFCILYVSMCHRFVYDKLDLKAMEHDHTYISKQWMMTTFKRAEVKERGIKGYFPMCLYIVSQIYG